MLNTRNFLATRRDAGTHSQQELSEFARLAARGEIPDYQISAWLMAAWLNPLSLQETVALTKGMAESGERLDLSELPKPRFDKHSTGGVGDKTSLVLLPILAACGLTVVKMSGQGLGSTGGTIDKLSSIPGFHSDLSPKQMVEIAKRCGLALAAQSPDLAPADGVLYALRDATETVNSIPLIVSSILSKKLAVGAEHILIDVKVGSGGFSPTLESAQELAKWLQEVGKGCGIAVRPVLTDMTQPLGEAVGNALEVGEALAILRNEPLSPPSRRFKDLVLKLAEIALETTGIKADSSEALTSGKAYEKAEAWLRAQGATQVDPTAEMMVETTLTAPKSGYLAKLDAGEIGRIVQQLGGGRAKKADIIDLQVGARIHALVGDQVQAGQPIATLYSRNELPKQILDQAIEIFDSAVTAIPALIETAV